MTDETTAYERPVSAETAVHTVNQKHYLTHCSRNRGAWSAQTLATCNCGRDIVRGTEALALSAFDDHIKDLLTSPGYWTAGQAYREGYNDAEGVLLAYLSGKMAAADPVAQKHYVALYFEMHAWAREINPFRTRPTDTDEDASDQDDAEGVEPADAVGT